MQLYFLPIMKKFLTLLILCFVINAHAQYKSDSILLTKTEWVTKNLDYLRFFKDSVVYNLDETKQQLMFDLKNKKLSFKVKYFVGGTNIKTEEFNFKIKQLQKNKLVLAPIEKQDDIKKKNYSRLNPGPFLKEEQLVFYNRGELISRVNFNKITFHASTCFGTCPSMSVEVNRDGTVYYQGRIYTGEFKGNFIGKLSAKDFYELRKIVNRSQLKSLDQKWKQKSRPNDTPRYNYIVELNDGGIIEMNTNDQHPILDKLSEYLLNISELTDLVRTNKKHEFTESNIDEYKVTQN